MKIVKALIGWKEKVNYGWLRLINLEWDYIQERLKTLFIQINSTCMLNNIFPWKCFSEEAVFSTGVERNL